MLLVPAPATDVQQPIRSTFTVKLQPISSGKLVNAVYDRHPGAMPFPDTAPILPDADQRVVPDTPEIARNNELEMLQQQQPDDLNASTTLTKPTLAAPTRLTANPVDPPKTSTTQRAAKVDSDAPTSVPVKSVDQPAADEPGEPDDTRVVSNKVVSLAPTQSATREVDTLVEPVETEIDEFDEDDFLPIALRADESVSTNTPEPVESTSKVEATPLTTLTTSSGQSTDQLSSVTEQAENHDLAIEHTAPALTPTGVNLAETGFNASAIRQEIRARFDHDLVYPPLAKKRGWEGNVDVMLRVHAAGNIRVLSVVQSSGFGLLDRYTRKTLEHIRLDEQTLKDLDGGYHDLRIEVQYMLLASRG